MRAKENISLYIDVKTRDIPSFSILLNSSKEYNGLLWPLFKSNKYGFPTFIKHLLYRPTAVITTSYNPNRSKEVAWRSRLSQSTLIEFTSEQYFSKHFEKEKLPTYLNGDFFSQDFFFTWSSAYAEKLVTIAGVPKDRIYIVGSPKIDLAKHCRRPMNDKINRILFVSDYGPASWDEQKVRELKRLYGAEISMTDIEVIRRERNSAIRCAIELSEIEHIEVTFRLHPGEDIADYSELLKSNVLISEADSDFLDDVSSCDLVIGYTSTSIFEVLACNIPFVSLHEQPYPDVVWRDYLPYVLDYDSADLIGMFKSNTKVNFSVSMQKIKEELRYFSLNLENQSIISPSTFWSAVNHTQKHSLVPKQTKLPPPVMTVKYSILGVLAGLIRIIVLLPGFKWILRFILGSSFHNTTHPMHNFSRKDLISFSSNLTTENVDIKWTLGDHGFHPEIVD